MLFPLALLAAGVLTPLVATTVLSLGLVVSASSRMAKTPTEKPARPTGLPPETPILNALSRLHDELKLDVSQDTLWCKAEKADWGTLGQTQTCLHLKRTEMLTLLAQPGADLRAVARHFDDFQAEEQRRCVANRERWLTVYEALDGEQREKVRSFLINRLEQSASADVTQSLRTSREAV